MTLLTSSAGLLHINEASFCSIAFQLGEKMSAAERKKRICIIGCGPAGMSALYHFSKLSDDDIPELVCYEKQETWGGLWNRTWRTGNNTVKFQYMYFGILEN